MALPMDRWLEMDLTWFDPTHDLGEQAEELLARIGPLLGRVSGQRGIFFNVGWLIDLVTEWQGDPSQALPTRSRRTAKWATRSYADLRRFFDLLRTTAEGHDLPDLQIGVLFVGWGHVVWPPELKIYDFDSDWYDRHPELYGDPLNFIGMPVLMPDRPLQADDYPYAAFPGGLADGTSFADFFGAQWGAVSRFLGLDAIHLRDGLTGPMVYTRNGPWGTTATSDPQALAAFSQAVRDLFRGVKLGNPDVLVFGYSSAISPTADWRVGGVDFEALVADGYIDAWVEQTWGGAWQDWWHQLWKGWTFQMANLLVRGAMIARANEKRPKPCKFYNLIETWDGWEPWDTIHQVPGKLRWAMWAFSHAAVLTPGGPKVPDGSYISWVNNGRMELLSEEDVRFVGDNLDAAQGSALELEAAFGPTGVVNRAMMAWLSEHHPEWNVSEWLDDQIGLLAKWGVPLLSATRAEWLGQVGVEALILQCPGLLVREAREAMLDVRGPVMATGRADVLDEPLRRTLGITPVDHLQPADFYVCHGDRADTPAFDRPYLPEHQPVSTADGVTSHYGTEQTPLLTSRGRRIYWQPPDWSEPFSPFVPKYQMGSSYPHFCAATLLHRAAQEAGQSHLADVSWQQPVAFGLWRSAGRIYLLLGNLETGYFGDSRLPRQVELHLSRSELGLETGDYHLRQLEGRKEVKPRSADESWLVYQLELGPEQSAVYQLER